MGNTELNKLIGLKEVWLYYDVPQIFMGETIEGEQFMCQLVEMEKDLVYLCVPVSNAQLSLLYTNSMSLRELFLQHKARTFKCIINKFDEYCNELIPTSALEEEIADWLPGEKSFIGIGDCPTEKIVEAYEDDFWEFMAAPKRKPTAEESAACQKDNAKILARVSENEHRRF